MVFKCIDCKHMGNCYQEECYTQMKSICSDFCNNLVGKRVFYNQKFFNDAKLKSEYKTVSDTVFSCDNKNIMTDKGLYISVGQVYLSREEARDNIK